MSNSISIIIPVYNEKESLEELYGEIRNATGSFSKREILFKNQDRLVDFLLNESRKVRSTNDLDKMKYMREKIRTILN